MPGLTPTFAEAVEFHKPSAEASAMFSAWYGFQHPGGEFEVCLRPGGVFYAPQFPANSRWCVMPSGDGAKIGCGAEGLGFAANPEPAAGCAARISRAVAIALRPERASVTRTDLDFHTPHLASHYPPPVRLDDGRPHTVHVAHTGVLLTLRLDDAPAPMM